MKVSRVRKRLLKGINRELPFVPHAYKDRHGYAYIGRHICIDRRINGFISPEEGEVLANGKLDRIEARLHHDLPIVFDLTEARQAVIFDLAYVMGVNNLLEDRSFIDLLKARKYSDLSDHVLAMAWDPEAPGRASRLAGQMASGQWPEDVVTQYHEF